MNQFGTDVMAMAVIVGGFAVGGASTLLFSDTPERAVYECTTTVRSQPRVVVAMGSGSNSFVVAPTVRVHTSDDCAMAAELGEAQQERVERVAEMARARADRAVGRVERARERGERAQERAARVRDRHSERAQEMHFEFDEGDFDFDFDFNFDFDGMEIDLEGLELQLEGLEGLQGLRGLEGLRGLQGLEGLAALKALEGMEWRLTGLEGDVGVEVERRIEEEMRRVEERLSQLNRPIGR